jgi:hypothetical protein
LATFSGVSVAETDGQADFEQTIFDEYGSVAIHYSMR